MDISSSYKLNNGNRIPVLGFGTYKLAQGKETCDSVLHALKTGYRLIDTASYYGNEQDVSKAIRASGIPREKIFVTTKIWNTEHADPLAAFEASRKRLGLEFIDLYLIHWPVSERNRTWKTLLPMLKTGKVRSLGVSNFTIRHLEELAQHSDAVPAVNQVEFSPFLYQKELLEYSRKRKIVLEAYAPLTRGTKFNHSEIARLSAKHGKTAGQIMLRWLVQHGIVPLPKSKTLSRIGENAAIFDFSLSGPDMKKLDSLNEDYRVTWDPSGMP